jgi:hypothetical protein
MTVLDAKVGKNIPPSTSTIDQFIRVIEKLPSDKPKITPGKSWRNQKEHWLGWLNDYFTPGAYGRQVDKRRDARYAYNHIVEYKMLLWIIEAAGVEKKFVISAQKAAKKGQTLQEKSAAIRKIVPWEVLAEALWK